MNMTRAQEGTASDFPKILHRGNLRVLSYDMKDQVPHNLGPGLKTRRKEGNTR